MIFGQGPLPFVFVFLLGLAAGACYQTIKLILKKIKANKLFVHSFDFLFVIVIGFCYYLICFYTLEGQFRLFTLIGLILGLVCEFSVWNLVKKAIAKRKRNDGNSLR